MRGAVLKSKGSAGNTAQVGATRLRFFVQVFTPEEWLRSLRGYLFCTDVLRQDPQAGLL